LTARHLNTQGGISQFGRTKVNYREDHLLFAYNTLVQRLYGAQSDIITKLDTANMIDGQRAGLCTMIDDYTWIGVAKDCGIKRLLFAKGIATTGPGAFTYGPELKQEHVWLKLEHRHNKGTMFYSLDGEHYELLGDRDYPFRTAWYEGTKVGLFCYNLSSGPEGGHADFDFFRQRHDGPETTRKE
jgi:beta-xylosidase